MNIKLVNMNSIKIIDQNLIIGCKAFLADSAMLCNFVTIETPISRLC